MIRYLTDSLPYLGKERNLAYQNLLSLLSHDEIQLRFTVIILSKTSMQPRSTLLQLFKGLRPAHRPPIYKFLSQQAIRPPLFTPTVVGRLPPSIAQSHAHHRLFHYTPPSMALSTVPIVDSSPTEIPLADTPKYQLTFTCKPCTNRSTHAVSKHGYEKGTVLVTCPDCKNRHVISDHLKIFSDKRITLEDILREKGELVRRGRVGPGGDVEFWDDDGPRGAVERKS